MPDLTSVTTYLVLAAGFLSGILASLIGVGGAIITTPFIRFLGATPIASVGSTVPAILPGALSGCLRYHREGYIQWRIALTCGLSGMAFAALGGWVAGEVDARWLMVATAVLVLWSGTSLLRAAHQDSARQGAHELVATIRDDPVMLIGLGIVAGFLAGLLGIGGGLVLTPGMTTLVRLPVKQAIATSLAAVAMMSITAMTTHIALGHVDWRFALPLAVGIVPGAQVGAHLTVGASDRTMRLVCGGLLVALAVVYLARELSGIL